jgi:translation initiation factor IF-2
MGANVDEAGPATPIEVLGLNDVPAAGDTFQVVADETEARRISSYRKDQAREDTLRRQKHTSLDQLFRNLDEDEIKELPVILKADVQGSVEGLVFALNKIESEKVNLRIVLQGVGNITENDVLLAAASHAIIIGFNVKTEPKALSTADQEGIEVRSYSVIYEVVKDIESAMLGLVAPTYEEQVLGKATVKQVFSVSRLGKVAGCQVDSGIVKRDAQVRLFRGEELLHTGVLQTLKRFKDDVNEVKAGYECGIGVRDYDNIEEGDTLEFFTMAEVQATEL